MAMYAPPGSKQYSETLPKAPGQPGFRPLPTAPTGPNVKVPGAPASTTPMGGGAMLQGAPAYQPQAVTGYQPQGVATQQVPSSGYQQTGNQSATNPAMMLGPQSPAPVAPMYGGSQGYMNQPVQGSTGGAYIGDTNPGLGLMMGGRENLGNYEYNAATDPATAYQRTAGYAKNKADQDQFAQQQNQWGSNTAGFQQHLQGQLNAAQAAQQPQLAANNAAANQLTAQHMAARGIGANGQQLGGRQFARPQMTPLQQMVRNRGAGGGDFVGPWTPPPKFASQRPSPLLQQLGV